MNAPQEVLPAASGAAFAGGLYAGISLHEGKAVALVLLPGELDDVNWREAVKWAEEQGGVLPSRIDQIVLFDNLKAEFKNSWYWSDAQGADDERWAWSQYFGDGSQSTDVKVIKLRVRAVRRLPL